MQHQKSLGIQSFILGRHHQIYRRFRAVWRGPCKETSTAWLLIPGRSLINESEANSCRSRISPFVVTEITEIVHAKGQLIWSGIACPSIILRSRCRHSSRIISPTISPALPYKTFRRYLGTQRYGICTSILCVIRFKCFITFSLPTYPLGPSGRRYYHG